MEYTLEELRALIDSAVGERKSEFERLFAEFKTKLEADAATAAAAATAATEAAAAEGADDTARTAATAATEAATAAAAALQAAIADVSAANPEAAARELPGFEPAAVTAALTAAADRAVAAGRIPAINGPRGRAGSVLSQSFIDGRVGEQNVGRGRYRYARHYQAEARRRAPTSFVRQYEPGDQALAVTVIGLHKLIASGDQAGARAWLVERGLSEGVGAKGGFLVPDEFAQDVIMKEGELTIFATTEFLRVFPMSTDVMKVPVLDTRPTVDKIEEGASGTGGTDPAIGRVELVARKYGRVIPITEELLDDASIAILEFLRDLYAEILAEKRTELITNGTGAGEVEGVRQNPDVTTQAFTGTQSNAADVLDWIEAIFWGIKAKYRNGPAIWLATAAMLETLSTVKDGVGRPILSQITDEPFQRLKGKPIFEDSFIPDNLGGGTNESELIFGNFRFYAFGDRMQMTVATDSGGKFFETDEVAMKVKERYDGRVAQAEAFVRGTGKTVS